VVEGAPLLRVYGSKAHRGFESLSLRQFSRVHSGRIGSGLFRSHGYAEVEQRDQMDRRISKGATEGDLRTVKASLRQTLTLTSTLIVALAQVVVPARAAGETTLGLSTAPVTLVEYGSLTCDYCVQFHREVMPELKRRYIDTGHVRYIFRDFPTSVEATRGAVAARCVRPDAYYATLEALFWSVGRWSRASDVDAALEQEVATLGLSTAYFRKCFSSPASQAAVEQGRRQAALKLDLLGTPTFMLNGRVVRGALTLRQMETLISEHLRP
jgi:protein-disulfide isomerase